MLIEYLRKVNNDNKTAEILSEKEMLDISLENADKIKNKENNMKD